MAKSTCFRFGVRLPLVFARRGLLPIVVFLCFLSVAVPTPASAGEDSAVPASDRERINYSVGFDLGSRFLTEEIEYDSTYFLKGLTDSLEKKNPAIPREQIQALLIKFRKKAAEQDRQAARRTADDLQKMGQRFLQENAGKPGVKQLPSGIQYKVIHEGTGTKPTMKDEVAVHYRVTDVSGREVASTYSAEKPLTVTMSEAIPGLQEVLQLMATGARWLVFLPTATAAANREPMDDMGVLIYDLELVSVIPAK